MRVHTDGEADRLAHEVDAAAFTAGPHVFFRAGAYDPESTAGRSLLAHEATHVGQQAAGPVAGTPAPGGVAISDPTDPFERAARQAGTRAGASDRAAGQALPIAATAKSSVSVQRSGLPGMLPGPIPPVVVDAVAVVAWLAPKQTAAELRQTRLELDAVPDGGTYPLPLHPVTMDAQQRTRLKEAVRHRVMERVGEVRTPLKPELASAADAAARRAVQDRMRSAARPFLDELRDPAQPGSRFEHPSTDVQNEVLAAVQLDAEGHAEEELADQAAHGSAGPRDRARAVAGLPEGAWCGAFAYTQQRSAGLSPEARAAMHSTGPHQGIDAFLDYEDGARVVWTGTEWKRVRDFHADRGSPRKLVRLPTTPTPVTPGSVYAPAGLDLQPGDIVLIDNFRGTFADHITLCRSYDPATGQLETIAGNEGGGPGQVAASAQPRDLSQNPTAQTVAGFDKPSRVYAYGRFSIVDYEVHTYLSKMPSDPTASPEAMAARGRGAPR